MRNLLLMALLAIAVPAGASDWVLVVVSTDGAIAVHADPASISRSGYSVKMASLLNYKKSHVMEGKPYLSYRSQDEYNCSIGSMRTLSTTFYAQGMGEGEVVGGENTPNAKFQPFAADSLDSSLWEFACATHASGP